ncbi:MAG: hypothetical protein QXQ33_00605 [Nitrososphaerota archaeon]
MAIDIFSDPLFWILTVISMLGIIIIILTQPPKRKAPPSTNNNQLEKNQKQHQQLLSNNDMFFTLPKNNTSPQPTNGESDGKNDEDPVAKLMNMVKIIKFIPGLKVCNNCNSNLITNDGRLAVYPYTRFTGSGGMKIELVCTKCGFSLWRWPMEEERRPSLEASAVDYPTNIKMMIKTARELSNEEAVAPPPPSPSPIITKTPTTPTSIIVKEPRVVEEDKQPELKKTAPQQLKDAILQKNEWLKNYSHEELGRLLSQCKGCPHYDFNKKKCLVPNNSKRVSPMFPSAFICFWWSAERLLSFIESGELKVALPSSITMVTNGSKESTEPSMDEADEEEVEEEE